MAEFFLSRLGRRLFAKKLPPTSRREAFGEKTEEVIYRKLREAFDCVIRNVVIPQGEGYLEKDFLVIQDGVAVVLEVKGWKGMISASAVGDRFYQEKADGTRKDLKSPVRSTNRFLNAMTDFYRLKEAPLGMVVFADPDCDLDLPPQMEGVALVSGTQMLSAIRALVKDAPKPEEPLDPARVLCCARLYAGGRSFCKGTVTDEGIPCFTPAGEPVLLNPLYLRYISVDHQPLRLRDKLTVTFVNDSAAVFYNHSATLTLLCLDGTVTRVALSKLDTIVF